MKKITLACLLLSSALLTACHENPLLKVKQEERARFLLKTSQTAEHQLGLSAIIGGGLYFNCMKGNEAKIDCRSLLQKMLTVAQEKLSVLRLSDLTDKAMFATIADEYQTIFFNTI